jgi:hypothetical protein
MRSAISQEEALDGIGEESHHPRFGHHDNASDWTLGKLGEQEFKDMMRWLEDSIDKESGKEEPDQLKIAEWREQLEQLKPWAGRLLDRHGKARRLLSGQLNVKQYKRVERNLGTCRKTIGEKMPGFADFLHRCIEREGADFLYRPPKPIDWQV